MVEIFQHQRLEPAAEWMNFLQALTDQAAIAIDNALLFKEQRQTTERLTGSLRRHHRRLVAGAGYARQRDRRAIRGG